MNETVINSKAEKNDATCEQQVDLYLLQINALQQNMAKNRQEILQLQAETRAILADVMATLRTL